MKDSTAIRPFTVPTVPQSALDDLRRKKEPGAPPVARVEGVNADLDGESRKSLTR
jgi:hypothetical protein